MDTSTSVSIDRLAYLMGKQDFVVPREDITNEEWVSLIEYTLETLRPHLQYLHGFTPLSTWVEKRNEAFDRDEALFRVREGLELTTRVQGVVGWFAHKDQDIPATRSGQTRYIDRELLITQRGELVLWSRVVTPVGDGVNLRVIHEQVKLVLNLPSLLVVHPSRTTANQTFPLYLLTGLIKLVETTIADRERRLEGLVNLVDELRLPLERMAPS